MTESYKYVHVYMVYVRLCGLRCVLEGVWVSVYVSVCGHV